MVASVVRNVVRYPGVTSLAAVAVASMACSGAGTGTSADGDGDEDTGSSTSSETGGDGDQDCVPESLATPSCGWSNPFESPYYLGLESWEVGFAGHLATTVIEVDLDGGESDVLWVRSYGIAGELLWTAEYSYGSGDFVAAAGLDGTVAALIPVGTDYEVPESDLRQFDSEGNELWSIPLGHGHQLDVTKCGDIAVIGDLCPNDECGKWLSVYDSAGGLKWAADEAGEAQEDAWVDWVNVDGSGGVAVKASLGYYINNSDWLGRYDSSGELLWEKRFSSMRDARIAVSDDGTTYAERHFSGDDDTNSLVAYDPDGTERWKTKIEVDGLETGNVMSLSANDEHAYAVVWLESADDGAPRLARFDAESGDVTYDSGTPGDRVAVNEWGDLIALSIPDGSLGPVLEIGCTTP
jgi:hypothetical protein